MLRLERRSDNKLTQITAVDEDDRPVTLNDAPDR
jgi:hypothetical protein